jgi:type VI secretion system secreted protein Hcp
MTRLQPSYSEDTMSIYLKIKGIPGDATTKGFEKSIEAHTVNLDCGRNVRMEVGKASSRDCGLPKLGGIELTKSVDRSSPLLFAHSCSGESHDTATIQVCHTSKEHAAYLEYTLDNVIVSKYHVDVSSENNSSATEMIELSYTKIRTKLIPRDANNRPQTPVIAGYDLEKAEVL